ncbi:hypothetical protein [Pseudomonas syringae]|nr:hypothetical protein [Pseudomonas syringae]
MSGSFIHFLVPSLDSALELTFFTLIVGGMLASLICAERYGRTATWERNWQGGTHKGALDLEHGSISELSHALASLPERIVSNMPGLLLIFGLLGTFLGLGMALDKASGVLQGSAESLDAMSDSLAQLTGMMKDLGSKFKTSTWGIIAFIVLKLWESSRWSAESRRTDWCVRQMKQAMDQGRKELRAYSDVRDRQAREALERVGERLVQSINAQSQLLAAEFKGLKLLNVQMARQAQGQHEALVEQFTALSNQIGEGNHCLASLDRHAATAGEHLEQLKTLAGQENPQAQEQHQLLIDHLTTLATLTEESNLSLDSLDHRAERATLQLDELQNLERQLAQQAQGHHGILIKQLMSLGTQAGDGNRSLASLDERSEHSVHQWSVAATQLQASVDGMARDLQQATGTITAAVGGLASQVEALSTRPSGAPEPADTVEPA